MIEIQKINELMVRVNCDRAIVQEIANQFSFFASRL